MPERDTRTEILRAGTPFAVGAVTLLPIERVVTHAQQGKTGAWFSLVREPCALVVRDAGGIRALDTAAAAVSVAQLREKIPELDVLLASM